MSATRRVFEVAKELNISHIEIINFLADKDIKVTIMSPLTDDNYSDILEHFYQEKNQVDRLRKEKARLNVIHHNQESETVKENEKNIDDSIIEKEDIKESDAKKEDTVEDKIDLKEKEEEKVESKEENSKIDSNDKNKKIKIKQRKEAPKLKKIDISSIIDKINTTKKKHDNSSSSQVKTSVSQLTKKTVKKKKNKKEDEIEVNEELEKKIISIVEFSTVDEFARSMDVPIQDVIMTCMNLGLMVTINQRLDMTARSIK